MGNATANFLANKSSRTSCQLSLSKALHSIINTIKSKMDQDYLDNVKLNNGWKRWVDIDSGKSLHILEHKVVIAKFKIFGGHDCLAHHLKRMNLIDSDIYVLESIYLYFPPSSQLLY